MESLEHRPRPLANLVSRADAVALLAILPQNNTEFSTTAAQAGADAIVTPCPLCHLSLDAWQSKLKKQTGKDFQMPILHLSQLIGVAAGLTDSELKFKRHVVSVAPVVEKLRV